MEILPILDFIEFCLLPYLSHKEIQLIQLKITQARPKKTDIFFLECFYYQKALELVKKYKKNAPHVLQHSELNIYSSLTRMEPEDILLVLSPDRYKISNEALTLVIGKPIDSLLFRRNQIVQSYENDGLKKELLELKSINLSEIASEIRSHTELNDAGAVKVRLTKLNKLPSPVKFVLEMAGVLLLLFFIMWLVPQVRSTYENSVQKRINEYLIDASLTDSPPPSGLAKPVVPEPSEPVTLAANIQPTEDLSAVESPVHKMPKVSEGETWRFSFTGQGQTDLSSQLSEIIEKKSRQKIKPLVVPGGVQFEFFLPVSDLASLKTEFEQLTATIQRRSANAAVVAGQPASSINMSWYKKKNLGQRKIPSGNVLAIIWISTL